MPGRAAFALLLLLVGSSSCTLPAVVESLDSRSPAPELGRPGWVTVPATGSAWVFGGLGAVLSVITLPVTFGITLVADEPLGLDRDEFLWFPVSIGATGGYYVIGAPLDTIDYVFRRAWVQTRPTDYTFEEQPPPIGPVPDAVAEAPAAEPDPDADATDPANVQQTDS